MKAFWGMPESGEVTDLRTEIKRLISDSTMSNRDKFVGFVGAFNKYDREVGLMCISTSQGQGCKLQKIQ